MFAWTRRSRIRPTTNNPSLPVSHLSLLWSFPSIPPLSIQPIPRTEAAGSLQPPCLCLQARSRICPVRLINLWPITNIALTTSHLVKILYTLDTSSQSYVTVLPERQPVYVHSIGPAHAPDEGGLGSCYLKAAARGICFAR